MTDYLQQLRQLYHLAPADGAVADARASTLHQPKILDLRRYEQYLRQRLLGSVNISLLSLTSCCYLLPDKSEPFTTVVPSDTEYTVVQDQSQHGMQLASGSTGVYVKGTVSVQEFLTTRGWSAVTFLHDSPQLWEAAQQLHLLERNPARELVLARRCLFSPSQLLASQIQQVEAALCAVHIGKQQQQQPQQQYSIQQQADQDIVHSVQCASKAGAVVLHALDVGCGSGRDLAWLASRQHAVHVGSCQPPVSNQQQQQQKPQVQHIAGVQPQIHLGEHGEEHPAQQSSIQVQWCVTGVDEWVGALERAHDLAAAMQLSKEHVELVLGSVDGQAGSIQLQRLPAKSKLHKATHATVIHDRTSAVDLLQSFNAAHAATATIAQDEPRSGTADVSLQAPAAWCSGFDKRRYDLILCVRFLERALLPRLQHMLNPGGFILYSTFVDGPGLRAFGRPTGHEHVLQPGELATQWLGPDQGFEVLINDVVVSGDGREVCWFAARLMV